MNRSVQMKTNSVLKNNRISLTRAKNQEKVKVLLNDLDVGNEA